jgi:hypothetical protein
MPQVTNFIRHSNDSLLPNVNKKALELTVKMFPEFEVLVEIYKLAFWCIAKKRKNPLRKHCNLLQPILFKSILILCPHTGVSEIQREFVFSPFHSFELDTRQTTILKISPKNQPG